MTEDQMPDEVIDEETLDSLPPSEAKKYRRRVIYEYIKDRPTDGATMTELTGDLPFNRNTIEKYMESLKAQRKVYAVQRGAQKIYKPNGTAFHTLLQTKIGGGDNRFVFKMVEHPEGNQIFIQEREKDEGDVWTDVGGITIPEGEIASFIGALERILEKKGSTEEY